MKIKTGLMALCVLYTSCSPYDIDNSEYTGLTGGPGVYVGGVFVGGRGSCWKNGEFYNLNEAVSSTIYSIFVTNSDVYLVGSSEITVTVFYAKDLHKPVYWKNGACHILESKSEEEAVGKTIWLVGKNSYIIGSDHSGKTRYWKNGHKTSAFKQVYYNGENGEKVESGVHYKAGSVQSSGDTIPAYWVNGVLHKLSCHTNSGEASFIHLSGDTVFVVGHENGVGTRRIKYWINGVETYLTDGLHLAYEKSSFVKDGVLYIAGYENDGNWINQKAKYWRMNEEFPLTAGIDNFVPTCIFVK